MDYFSHALHWLTEMVWPTRCLGCGAFGTLLCRHCLDRIPRRSAQECIVCTHESRHGVPCGRCAPHTLVDRLLVAGRADHPLLSQAIYAFKYRSARMMAVPLAEYLMNALAKTENAGPLFGTNPLLVPVPLHRRRLAERGFNQSELLAHRLAAHIGMTVRSDVLERTRHTASQVGTTSRWERLDNMKDAFAVSRPELVAGHDIVLVDDICTTGATLDACARALKDAGAGKVSAIVLARG